MKHGPRDRRRPEEKPDALDPEEGAAASEAPGVRDPSPPPATDSQARTKQSVEGEEPAEKDSDDDSGGSTHQTGGFFF